MYIYSIQRSTWSAICIIIIACRSVRMLSSPLIGILLAICGSQAVSLCEININGLNATSNWVAWLGIERPQHAKITIQYIERACRTVFSPDFGWMACVRARVVMAHVKILLVHRRTPAHHPEQCTVSQSVFTVRSDSHGCVVILSVFYLADARDDAGLFYQFRRRRRRRRTCPNIYARALARIRGIKFQCN